MSYASDTDLAALDAAVDAFAAEMKRKLRAKADAGWCGWNGGPPEQWVNGCFSHLRRLDRGDMNQAVDVANFAMFTWNAAQYRERDGEG